MYSFLFYLCIICFIVNVIFLICAWHYFKEEPHDSKLFLKWSFVFFAIGIILIFAVNTNKAQIDKYKHLLSHLSYTKREAKNDCDLMRMQPYNCPAWKAVENKEKMYRDKLMELLMKKYEN